MRRFRSVRSLLQHLRHARPGEYNLFKQDRDLERQGCSRPVKRWTDEELESMAALELVAMKNMKYHLEALLGRSTDQVCEKRREERYKILRDRLSNLNPDKLCALISRGTTNCASSRTDSSTLMARGRVTRSLGPANGVTDAQVSGEESGVMCRADPPTSNADGKRIQLCLKMTFPSRASRLGPAPGS